MIIPVFKKHPRKPKLNVVSQEAIRRSVFVVDFLNFGDRRKGVSYGMAILVSPQRSVLEIVHKEFVGKDKDLDPRNSIREVACGVEVAVAFEERTIEVTDYVAEGKGLVVGEVALLGCRFEEFAAEDRLEVRAVVAEDRFMEEPRRVMFLVWSDVDSYQLVAGGDQTRAFRGTKK